MAEEGMLDRAMGMIPGVGKKKPARRRKATKSSTISHIASLRKSIAKLAYDLEKLVGLVKEEKKAVRAAPAKAAKRTTRKPAAAAPKSAGRKPAGRKRPVKKPAARKA